MDKEWFKFLENGEGRKRAPDAEQPSKIATGAQKQALSKRRINAMEQFAAAFPQAVEKFTNLANLAFGAFLSGALEAADPWCGSLEMRFFKPRFANSESRAQFRA